MKSVTVSNHPIYSTKTKYISHSDIPYACMLRFKNYI